MTDTEHPSPENARWAVYQYGRTPRVDEWSWAVPQGLDKGKSHISDIRNICSDAMRSEPFPYAPQTVIAFDGNRWFYGVYASASALLNDQAEQELGEDLLKHFYAAEREIESGHKVDFYAALLSGVDRENNEDYQKIFNLLPEEARKKVEEGHFSEEDRTEAIRKFVNVDVQGGRPIPHVFGYLSEGSALPDIPHVDNAAIKEAYRQQMLPHLNREKYEIKRDKIPTAYASMPSVAIEEIVGPEQAAKLREAAKEGKPLLWHVDPEQKKVISDHSAAYEARIQKKEQGRAERSASGGSQENPVATGTGDAKRADEKEVSSKENKENNRISPKFAIVGSVLAAAVIGIGLWVKRVMGERNAQQTQNQHHR